jgi:hypothetical protein
MKPSASTNPGHEGSDASLKLIGLIAVSLVLGIASVLLTARWIVGAGDNPERRAAELGTGGNFQHGPEEETAIAQDWADIAAQTQLHLHTYGWVDRRAGIARIPIDRAMDLLASRAEGKAAP